MRRLILLRHAKSDWSGIGLKDKDRGLASRGRDSAPRVGAYMAHHALVPDLALVSTATRARDTWSLLVEAFGKPPRVVYEERLYETGPRAIFDVIKSIAREIHVLLVVGHNPGLRGVRMKQRAAHTNRRVPKVTHERERAPQVPLRAARATRLDRIAA